MNFNKSRHILLVLFNNNRDLNCTIYTCCTVQPCTSNAHCVALCAKWGTVGTYCWSALFFCFLGLLYNACTLVKRALGGGGATATLVLCPSRNPPVWSQHSTPAAPCTIALRHFLQWNTHFNRLKHLAFSSCSLQLEYYRNETLVLQFSEPSYLGWL